MNERLYSGLLVGVKPVRGKQQFRVRTLVRALVVVTIVLTLAAPAWAAGTLAFGFSTLYSTNGVPNAVEVTDLNKDGHLDLVAANLGASNDLSVFLGDGTGKLGARQDLPVGVNAAPIAVDVGDFNGDGNADLVSAQPNVHTLSVRLGNGDGTFRAPVNYSTSNPWSVSAGDLNNDGKADLVTGAGSRTVSVLLGNGDGSFQDGKTFAAASDGFPVWVALGDFNRDGKPDVATANGGLINGFSISVFSGNGDGTLGTRKDIVVGSAPLSIAANDLDGDSNLDLVAANNTDNNAVVMLGNGDGTFQAKHSYAVGTRPYSVAVADMDGDDKSDLVTANYAGYSISVLRGKGDGTFVPKQDFSAGPANGRREPIDAEAGDFNGDGRPDVATANRSTSEIGILIQSANQPPTPDAGGPYSGDEGGAISLHGNVLDSDGDALGYSWTYMPGTGVDAGATCSFADRQALNTAITCTDDGTYTVRLTADDGKAAPVTSTAAVTVNNVAPSVRQETGPTDPVAVGTAVNASAQFADAGANDTHSGSINWGDGTTTAAAISSGTASGTHTYEAAGVYTIEVIVTDDDGGVDSATFQYAVVYDPAAGFVSGGGWIVSSAGAYASDPSLTGEANFGFVSKYQKGATTPTGQTQFQFQAAGLNFRSSSYEWLVVSGPKAQYKGSGTINGTGDYGFMLTANDGQATAGGGTDKFRIKIWEKASGNVVYDNQMGDADDATASTAIQGGSIVIHGK